MGNRVLKVGPGTSNGRSIVFPAAETFDLGSPAINS